MKRVVSLVSKIIKYSSFIYVPFSFYKLKNMEKNYVETKMFQKGFNVSQKFKNYQVWDNFFEPIIIRQASILFVGIHSFLEGLTSDNNNKDAINNSFKEFNKIVTDEIEKNKSNNK